MMEIINKKNIKMSKLPMNRVRGNTPFLWLGQLLLKITTPIYNKANELIEENRTKIVSNPSAEFFNPFTMVISFTVDVSSKFQILLQGDYRDKYKESGDKSVALSDEDLYIIINQNRNLWFKKYK